MPLSPNSPDNKVVLIVVNHENEIVSSRAETYDDIKKAAGLVWAEEAKATPNHTEFARQADTYREMEFEAPYDWRRDIARNIWMGASGAYYPNWNKEYRRGILYAFAILYLKFLNKKMLNSVTPILMRQCGKRPKQESDYPHVFFGLCDEKWAMRLRREVTIKKVV